MKVYGSPKTSLLDKVISSKVSCAGPYIDNMINPFMPIGISRPFHLDESISNLKIFRW